MSKVLGYLRTSTDKQEINNQRLEILEYARKEDLKVSDFIETQVSSRKSLGERKMGELFEKLNADDVLIVTELSRIGRSTIEVLSIVKELVQNGVDIVFIKQNLKINATNNATNNNDMVSKVMITMFSLFAELERDLISHRTKEALRSKKASNHFFIDPTKNTQY
jgi:DNA invertase Pin-like site-specific DNA recombinase